jgi:hypothetical protein
LETRFEDERILAGDELQSIAYVSDIGLEE